MRQMKRAARCPCGCGGIDAEAGAEALVRQENETRGYVDMEGHACDDDDDFEQGKDDEEKAEKAK